MYQIALLFKIIISLFSIIPFTIFCTSKRKCAKFVPRKLNDQPPKTVYGTVSSSSVTGRGSSMAPPVKAKSKVVKVEAEPEKKPRHSTEISINTGFEMDKKENNKSSSVSVVV